MVAEQAGPPRRLSGQCGPARGGRAVGAATWGAAYLGLLCSVLVFALAALLRFVLLFDMSVVDSNRSENDASLLLAAWGGKAVACAQEGDVAECAALMVDGSSGRAACCMRLTSGAVGGAVPLDGLFCACADFRSGADCGLLGPGAFVYAAVYVLLNVATGRLFVFAQSTLLEIVAEGKQGGGEPARVIRAVQLSIAAMGLNQVSSMLMILSPLPYDALWAAFDVTNAILMPGIMAMAAYLLVMFRKVSNEVAQLDSTVARDTRAAHAFALAASLCLLATARTQLKQVVIMSLGVLVALPAMFYAVRVKRLMDVSLAHSLSPSEGGDQLDAALGRIMRMFRHAALFLLCFVGLRLIMQITQHAMAPVQGALGFYLRQITRLLNYVNGLHILTAALVYVGGPARAAHLRRGTKRANSARVSSAPRHDATAAQEKPSCTEATTTILNTALSAAQLSAAPEQRADEREKAATR